jgi:hypothetical protein
MLDLIATTAGELFAATVFVLAFGAFLGYWAFTQETRRD